MKSRASGLLAWIAARDRGFAALRRAGRAAIVMPAMFALAFKVIGNPTVATFAAFGSFSMLLLVDFTGPMRDRLQAQAALALVGAAFVCIGTLASQSVWGSTVAMGIVGFAVLFVGVVSSVLASATPALLLAFILPVTLSGPASSIPDRLAGWGLASAAALLAIALLWPAPTRDPLRNLAVQACRELAARLRADVALRLGGETQLTREEHREAVARANAAVAALHNVFLATPFRPTGLSTGARAVVRLVDELNWVNTIVIQSEAHPAGIPVNRVACKARLTAALVLERGADLLASPAASVEPLRDALVELRGALTSAERSTTMQLPANGAGPQPAADAPERSASQVVSALDPSFRAQELSFAVSQIASNIGLAAAAERRGWVERLLGRQPAGLTGTLAAAQERAGAHVQRNSVWLHNSVRGAVGLALAVLVANRTGVQHSFWVVLGALSVLRSNALSTGQNVLRGLLGTAVGFVIGALLLSLIGTDTTVLWLLLPFAVLLAGAAPAVISFAAGQAAFTLTLLILYNIIQPLGWRVGLLRIEDIALGCAVSLVVGLLFWPRGAGAALGKALAEAYTDSVGYLAGAVRYGMGRCDRSVPGPAAPTEEAVRAAAASRRLDDAFRGYLAEHGAKPVGLAEVSSLVTGVVGLRLAGDAVLELWNGDDPAGGDRTAARRELLAAAQTLAGWYDAFAASLTGETDVPVPLDRDSSADGRLVEAVSHDLRGVDGQATATAVRMIWTGDHLDAARRLQATLVAPARTAAEQRALAPSAASLLPWRE